MVIGYTTLMSPNSMRLPFLEALLSWSKVCDKIAICYSRFPKLDLDVPEGAVVPWEDDGSWDLLKKFDEEVLGNKLVVIENEWRIDYPREDGRTKQLARNLAISESKDEKEDWLIQFDADEILREQDLVKYIEFFEEQQKQKTALYAITGVLEMFGGINKVRFGSFGSWLKIRLTRPMEEIIHDLEFKARARNPRTGHLIAQDNKDDGAGYLFRYSLARPDYNQGFHLPLSHELTAQAFQAGQGWSAGQLKEEQFKEALGKALEQEAWVFHAAWIDIARKWSMGWFWDNMWGLLNGTQDTFTEKAEKSGAFTHTRAPSGEELEKDIALEMSRPGIVEIDNSWPIYFDIVKKWKERASNPLNKSD